MKDDTVTVTYSRRVVWSRDEGRDLVGRAGARVVARITPHYITGTPSTTWFEDRSDEQDNSVTGSEKFLMSYIEGKWGAYLDKLKGEEK